MIDALVIGGGFYGCEIALALRRFGLDKVEIVELEGGILRRASFVNQARVHNGYHYPRSVVTAKSSRSNYRPFVNDYAEAIVPGMQKLYAIARNSRVGATQFESFCRQIGAPCDVASRSLHRLFDDSLIEAVFVTEESAFDARKLARILWQLLEDAHVSVRCGGEAKIVSGDEDHVDVAVGQDRLSARYVFNCTYAELDNLGVELKTPLKKELAEIALIEPPPELRNLGVTVVDGPFFSVMPFPSMKVHSLTHVRHTPHASGTGPGADLKPWHSKSQAMLRDAQRYLPALSRARLIGSLYELKVVLQRNEDDDGRPIMFERSRPRVLSVLGGKIDNIYDVRTLIESGTWGC